MKRAASHDSLSDEKGEKRMRLESIDVWNDVLCFDVRNIVFTELLPCPVAQRALALTCKSSYEEGRRHKTHKFSLLGASKGKEWEIAYVNFMEAGPDYWPVARRVLDWYGYDSDIPFKFGDAEQLQFASRVVGPYRYLQPLRIRLLLRNGHGAILEDFFNSCTLAATPPRKYSENETNKGWDADDRSKYAQYETVKVHASEAFKHALASGDAHTIDVAARYFGWKEHHTIHYGHIREAILSGSASSIRELAKSFAYCYERYRSRDILNLLPSLKHDLQYRERLTAAIKILHREHGLNIKKLAAPLAFAGLLDAFQYVMTFISNDRHACERVVRDMTHTPPNSWSSQRSNIEYKSVIAILDTIAAYGADLLTDPLSDADYRNREGQFTYHIVPSPISSRVTLRSGAVLYFPRKCLVQAIICDSACNDSIQRLRDWEEAGVFVDLQDLAQNSGSASLLRVIVTASGFSVSKEAFLACLLNADKWENALADLEFAKDHADDKLNESLSKQFRDELQGLECYFLHKALREILSRELYDFHVKCVRDGEGCMPWYTEWRLVEMLQSNRSEAEIEEFTRHTLRPIEVHHVSFALYEWLYLRLSQNDGYVPYVRYVFRTMRGSYITRGNARHNVIVAIGMFDLVDKLIALRPLLLENALDENPFDDNTMETLAGNGASSCIMYVVKEGLWFPTTHRAYRRLARRCTWVFKHLLLNYKERLHSLGILQDGEIDKDIAVGIINTCSTQAPGGSVHALSFLLNEKMWPSTTYFDSVDKLGPALIGEFVANGYSVLSEVQVENVHRLALGEFAGGADEKYIRYLDAKKEGNGWFLFSDLYSE